MTEIQRLAEQAVEKQAFAGAVGAGIGGLIGAANLPEDASVAQRAQYASQGALRGAGLGAGLQAGSGLGYLGSKALLSGQKDPSTTRQVIATLLPFLGGGLGSALGYGVGDAFARSPGLELEDDTKEENPDAGDRADANAREERMEEEKQGFDDAPLTEAQLAQNNYYGWSIPRSLNQISANPGILRHRASAKDQPSVWDYLKSPIKNLATGGRYTQEKNMSRVYDQIYSPDLQKGPKPAAGNSIRKAIKPMENNPMGGYSTPSQSVFTPYPRKKQGSDGILSSLLGPSEEDKQRAEDKEKLDKAVARNMRERIARQIAKEKLGSDKEAAASIAYLGSVLEKAAKRGLWDNVHAKRKRGEKPAKPGDKDYPDEKSWKKTTKEAALKSLVLEKIAKSPAWQRKAGKNSEGGLNAKGRASYNKATGGNLKAPVTQKNPKGKAKKRKASFCARMSGMKKKNTSKATANDPDSRINKSLRKWNC